jgi:hypothetical protein
VRISTLASNSGVSGAAGAGSKIVRAPSARASFSAAATVSNGDSNWNNTKRDPRKTERIASVSDAASAWFAPDATTMEFSPAVSTEISATPVACARVA